MNKQIQELAKRAGFALWQDEEWNPGDVIDWSSRYDDELVKFANLIVQECTQLLFNESERLYTYSSECDNMSHSDDAELCAEKCMDNIKMIEEHFVVSE